MVVGFGPVVLENHTAIIQLVNKEVCQNVMVDETFVVWSAKKTGP
jgi:hypothetical protein